LPSIYLWPWVCAACFTTTKTMFQNSDGYDQMNSDYIAVFKPRFPKMESFPVCVLGGLEGTGRVCAQSLK